MAAIFLNVYHFTYPDQGRQRNIANRIAFDREGDGAGISAWVAVSEAFRFVSPLVCVDDQNRFIAQNPSEEGDKVCMQILVRAATYCMRLRFSSVVASISTLITRISLFFSEIRRSSMSRSIYRKATPSPTQIKIILTRNIKHLCGQSRCG
jgi:hypothetical protein